jgi:hypothetical protein
MSVREGRTAVEMGAAAQLIAIPSSTGKNGNSSFDSITWTPTAPTLIIFVLVALLLSSRQLYIALDDAAYLDYFANNTYWAGVKSSEDWNWWKYLIEEPLWNIYSAWLGEAVGAETAFRVTIFASTFLYLTSASRLSDGGYKMTLLLFALQPHIGMQMYFNQIRQGAALSVFLALVAFLSIQSWKRIAIAATAASLIHSSFILLICIAPMYVMRPWPRVLIATLGVAMIVAVSQYVNIFAMIDIGRREQLYTSAGAVNANFYIVTILTYVAIFYVLAPSQKNINVSEWYFLSFLIAAAAVGASAVHEAAARFVYLAEAVICVLVARNVRTQNGIVALAIWLLVIVALIISEYKYNAFGQLGVFHKWEQVIF